jgi:hypothetical protein
MSAVALVREEGEVVPGRLRSARHPLQGVHDRLVELLGLREQR